MKGCSLCLSCAASASLTKTGLCCPLCDYRFRPDVITEITQARANIIGVANSPLTCLCRQCKATKPLSEFQVLQGSTHRCWLCDSCLLKLKVEPFAGYQKCWQCADIISSGSLGLIVQWQRNSQVSVPLDNLRCALCAEVKSERDFSYRKREKHACEVCDNCHIRKIFPYAQCLLCSQSFRGSLITIDEPFRCTACNASKAKSHFKVHFYMQHACKLCDFCIGSSQRACRTCSLPFSDNDSELIQVKIPPAIENLKRCHCGNLISPSGIQCEGKCYCSGCHLTHILLNHTKQCSLCSSVCTGNVPTQVKCGSCCRILPTNGTDLLVVSGVCTKGHILCQHCIKIEQDNQLICPLCKTYVQGRSATELKHAQSKLFLACFCDKPSGEMLEKLPCEHQIHWSCKNALSACRLCGRKWRERQEETVWKYVPRV